MKTRRIFLSLFLAAFFAMFAQGCFYSGVAMNQSGSKVAILQNDSFLFGALRKVYVCEVDGIQIVRCRAQTP
ncbi:MAG: hypothetical protein H6728_06380 [Myxococcales bacterium]|nr:hypothetical protein [Myxococcales bacterium]MCB9642686.1 hypothetical protein [Myxococcales bacterium]